jgi:hypothetical protein
MNAVLERIFRSLDRDPGEVNRGKLRNYILLLASTGKTDEQLVELGKAYLNETQNPDHRYSGC